MRNDPKEQEQFGLGEVSADAINESRLAGRTSDLPNVLTELNALIRLGIIEDYAIGGGYAVMYHGIPYSTFDLDVFVILGSEKDYHKIYSHYREQGNKEQGVYIYIADMPVQFLPNFISPLFNDAIQEAEQIKVSGVPSKVVKVEYLIALLLTAFRPKDKIHVIELAKVADMSMLNEILRRFDEGQRLLSKRLEEVLGKP
ncbi:hypothetical protein ES703_59426 [subsurface metagenome]